MIKSKDYLSHFESNIVKPRLQF